MKQQEIIALKQISDDFIDQTNTKFQRFLMGKIDWSWRLNAVIGPRGSGKTTLLLQHLKEHFGKSDEAMYLSLDNFYFSENRLYFLATEFLKNGGTHLYIDEVHKYSNWAQEIKNLYDQFPQLHITFTGSSIIEILKQEVDLSRRAIEYNLPGLSFREYLLFKEIIDIPTQTLEDVLSDTGLSLEVNKKIRPLVHFRNYIKSGYYPFFLESEGNYLIRLQKVVRLIIENDLNFIEGYDPRSARKISQLLYILASNVPFKPNISELSRKTGIHRNTLIQYLHYLERATLIHSLSYRGNSVSTFQKPDKLLLRHPNLAYVIAPVSVNSGSTRESFFVSQLSVDHQISLHKSADFIVDDKYVFEVGGSNKKHHQIKDLNNAYVVKDDLEKIVSNNIPLWMFGLLY